MNGYIDILVSRLGYGNDTLMNIKRFKDLPLICIVSRLKDLGEMGYIHLRSPHGHSVGQPYGAVRLSSSHFVLLVVKCSWDLSTQLLSYQYASLLIRDERRILIG